MKATDMATLKELRERLGMKAEEVAYRLGVAHSTLRNWESGKSRPTMNPQDLLKTLELYQCTLEEFAEATAETYQGDK